MRGREGKKRKGNVVKRGERWPVCPLVKAKLLENVKFSREHGGEYAK